MHLDGGLVPLAAHAQPVHQLAEAEGRLAEFAQLEGARHRQHIVADVIDSILDRFGGLAPPLGAEPVQLLDLRVHRLQGRFADRIQVGLGLLQRLPDADAAGLADHLGQTVLPRDERRRTHAASPP